MSRKRTYNRVVQANDVCPLGELLTGKELERMKLHNCRRDWPETKKAKVYADVISVYDLEQENNMKKAVYLCVERDGSEYDYKAGFASYTEADDYRQECQRSWVIVAMYIFGLAPRELPSQECREKRIVKTV